MCACMAPNLYANGIEYCPPRKCVRAAACE